jgi:hypothetical protein
MSFIRLNASLSGLRFSEPKYKPTIRNQQFGYHSAIIYNFVRYRIKWVRPVGPLKKRDEVPTLRQYLQSLKPQKPIKLRRWKKKITPLNPYAKVDLLLFNKDPSKKQSPSSCSLLSKLINIM